MDPGNYGKELHVRCTGDYIAVQKARGAPGEGQLKGQRVGVDYRPHSSLPMSTSMERPHEEVGFELGFMEGVRFTQSEMGLEEEHDNSKRDSQHLSST